MGGIWNPLAQTGRFEFDLLMVIKNNILIFLKYFTSLQGLKTAQQTRDVDQVLVWCRASAVLKRLTNIMQHSSVVPVHVVVILTLYIVHNKEVVRRL